MKLLVLAFCLCRCAFSMHQNNIKSEPITMDAYMTVVTVWLDLVILYFVYEPFSSQKELIESLLLLTSYPFSSSVKSSAVKKSFYNYSERLISSDIVCSFLKWHQIIKLLSSPLLLNYRHGTSSETHNSKCHHIYDYIRHACRYDTRRTSSHINGSLHGPPNGIQSNLITHNDICNSLFNLGKQGLCVFLIYCES